jgi:two-component system, OmpR family, response regulator RegX3
MTSEVTLLVVEDEESYRDALMVGLSREGFRVVAAKDGMEALALFDEVQPDLVLLDVMLPKMSGLDVCKILRKKSNVPIIMVTARAGEIDTVVALEVGADDYVTKPYRLRELVARMRAVLRRGVRDDAPLGPAIRPHEDLITGDVVVDVERHEVTVRGQIVALPLKEFDLLELLVANSGRVLPRDVILDRVWGSDYYGDTKTLDVHIKRLRQRVETDPASPARIITIRGLGYKYVPNQ